MRNRTVLQVSDADAQERYESLIDFCAGRCLKFSVVTNTRALPGLGVSSFFADARPYVEREQQQTSWPGGGTLFPGYSCTVTYLTTSTESIALLKLRAHSSFDWVHPDLPEDLAFYRPDGSAFFIVIGHERVAYFDASDAERAEIEQAIPGIAFMSIGKIVLHMDDDETPEDPD